jgi:hypothetical protein
MADFRFHPDSAPKEPVWRNADRFRAGSAEDPSTYPECMAKGVRLKPP